MLQKTKRLLYIDALRGLAMLMVVFVHTEIFSFFNFNHTTTFMYILSAIHMPLFFFISGVCIYKPNKIYDLERIKNDFVRLIIPAISIGLLYTYCVKGGDCMFFITNSMKAGYWFTISLFEVLMIYYLIYNLTRNNNKIFMILLWGIAILLFLLKLPFKMFEGLDTIGNYLCLHQTFNYFFFFSLGITSSKYKEKTIKLIEKSTFCTSILVLFAIILVIMYGALPKFADNSVMWRVLENLGETTVSVLGVSLLYVIFFKSQRVFNSSNKLCSILIFIGNNTLAIYLIHYFFLPVLPQWGKLLLSYPSFLVEVVLSLSVSLIVIGLSLLVNLIVKIVSPFISHSLLGGR